VEELKRAGIFQGADEDSQRRKRMVEERLWARSNNSYLTIQQDLRKVEEIIASGGTEEELNRVLHESSTDPQVLVRSEIERLEAMLKPREIQEINELLIWNAARNLRECLDIIREKVASEGPDRPDFINQSAADRLSMVYLDRAMQTDGEESEADVEGLRQIHGDDPAAKGPKSALASLYTFKGQRDKARDIFRADIIEAFNILADDNIFNDLDGFIALRNLLNRTGDYENALRAALLLPELRFDDTVLKTLLAREGPSMEAVSEELVQIYHRECSDPDQHWQNLTRVWQEANRLEWKLFLARGRLLPSGPNHSCQTRERD
jgi:hypothetical protein